MGYEHLSDPLHILIEAELPANVIDTRLRQAQDIIEELLKPVVCVLHLLYSLLYFVLQSYELPPALFLLGKHFYDNMSSSGIFCFLDHLSFETLIQVFFSEFSFKVFCDLQLTFFI